RGGGGSWGPHQATQLAKPLLYVGQVQCYPDKGHGAAAVHVQGGVRHGLAERGTEPSGATEALMPGRLHFRTIGMVLHGSGILLGVGQNPPIVRREGDARGDLLAEGRYALLERKVEFIGKRLSSDNLSNQDGLVAQIGFGLCVHLPLDAAYDHPTKQANGAKQQQADAAEEPPKSSGTPHGRESKSPRWRRKPLFRIRDKV